MKDRSSRPVVFLKISQNSQENTCVGIFNFIEKESPAHSPTQVFSCEYCEILKNTNPEDHLLTAAFEIFKLNISQNISQLSLSEAIPSSSEK